MHSGKCNDSKSQTQSECVDALYLNKDSKRLTGKTNIYVWFK